MESVKILHLRAPRERPDELLALAQNALAKLGELTASSLTAAASQVHPNPSEAQRESGNYKKGHVTWKGLDIAIETAAGQRRKPEWPPLKHHYGYFKGTESGADGDPVDVFVNDANLDSEVVFVVNQNKADGGFDEHKVVIGCVSEEEARKTYLANYSKGWKGLGSIKAMTLGDFKNWLREGDTSKRASDRLWVYACPHCGGDAYNGVPGTGTRFRGGLKCSKCGKGSSAIGRTPRSKHGPPAKEAADAKIPLPLADRVKRDAFLYLSPEGGGEDFAQCGTCAFFGKTHCALFTGDFAVDADDSCGCYLPHTPAHETGPVPALNLISPGDAGFVKRKVRCENCYHGDARTRDGREEHYCKLYADLNKTLPAAFDLEEVIRPKACCNAHTEPPEEKSASYLVLLKRAGEKKEVPFTVAVDLDGTIFEAEEPFNPKTVGRLRKKVKRHMLAFRKAGARLIIFTVRGDAEFVKAQLKKHGVPFDYVNENPDQPPDSSGKVFAHAYWDDRGWNALDPDEHGPKLLAMAKAHGKEKQAADCWLVTPEELLEALTCPAASTTAPRPSPAATRVAPPRPN